MEAYQKIEKQRVDSELKIIMIYGLNLVVE